MAKKTNMYKLSIKQWNPFVGCKHHCKYCGPSFQSQLKRYGKKNCQSCYEFEPHTHPSRLHHSLPSTKFMQFIFTCSNGDIAFCPTNYLQEILSRIKEYPDRTFLVQSKNPKTFNRVIFPNNVILGTTIETNRDDLYKGIANAPSPSERFEEFIKVKHPLKMVTIEPIIEFDLDILLEWMKDINPCMIWLGYDSKRCYLPEPELEKVRELHWELSRAGFVVILKTVREAR